MTPEELKTQLQKRLPNKIILSTNDLREALRACFPGKVDSTLAWRISQLKKKNFLQQVTRGKYTFQFKPEYNSELSLKSKRTLNRIKSLCKSNPAAWDTGMIDVLLHTNNTLKWIFIELDRSELDEVFGSALQFSKRIFLNPDKETIARYILPLEDAIILLPKVSETPTNNLGDFKTLSVEGLLVNIYWHYEKFFKPTGYNIEAIFENALRQYNVNTSKLLRFAARRDKRAEIEQLLTTIAI